MNKNLKGGGEGAKEGGRERGRERGREGAKGRKREGGTREGVVIW